MADERRQRIEDLFHAALDLPAAARQEFLQSECADDPELLAEIESLLQHDTGDATQATRVGRWIDQLPSDLLGSSHGGEPLDAHTSLQPTEMPSEIGDYRILARLAEGGMGIVYRAEQSNPRRIVALKVIRPDFASDQTMRRFEYEASILGRLQHPGIAQIYEAGTAALDHNQVRAFFAMEFVDGCTLVEHAVRTRATTEQRLELVAQVCDAVEHAHRNGVIHRDIKPANIMVDAAGQPKVLDFGVARAVDPDLQHTTAANTMAGQLVGTVPYMSPEQVAGNPARIDTRSDVYALGVTLYELLTGSLPYDLSNKSLLDAARVIQEVQPNLLSSTHRQLRGDIETIVGKALEKDVDQRYDSAAALAADIRRHLSDEPILARPPSAMYQLRKFAKRNKLLVGGTVTLLVILIGGIVGIWDQYLRAEHARGVAVEALGKEEEAREVAEVEREKAVDARDAEEIARQEAERSEALAWQEHKKALNVGRFLRDMLIRARPDEALGRDVTVMEALNAAAETLERQASGMDPEVHAELRIAIGLTYLRLGDWDRADTHLTRAFELRTEHEASIGNRLAEAASNLAELRLRQARFEEAKTLIGLAIDSLGANEGGDSPRVIAARSNFATLQRHTGDLSGAYEQYQEIVATLRTLKNREVPLAGALYALGSLCWEINRLDEAETSLREALQIFTAQLNARHPQIASCRASLGYVMFQRGQADEGERLLGQALAMQREVLPEAHPKTALTLTLLGAGRVADNRAEDGEAPLREALRTRIQTLPEGHWHIANAASLLGECLSRQRRFEEAESLLLDAWEKLQAHPGTPRPRLREATLRLAEHFQLSDQPERAKQWRLRAE